jgi:hypothetical protein
LAKVLVSTTIREAHGKPRGLLALKSRDRNGAKKHGTCLIENDRSLAVAALQLLRIWFLSIDNDVWGVGSYTDFMPMIERAEWTESAKLVRVAS